MQTVVVMRQTNTLRAADSTQLWETVFTPYRAKILYPIAIVGAAIFVPLAIIDFLRGRTAISAVLLCVVAMLAVDAVALYRRREPPVPFPFLLVPGCAGVAMSLATQGIYGALWSYPVVFLSFFVLRRSAANVVSVSLLVAGTFLTALTQDAGTTARYSLSLALCLVVINIMLNVLDALHARLLEQTITDPLTGAFNRRHLDASVDETIERYRRARAPAAALLIDIDHFKRINDRLGHAMGDDVLRKVVAIIEERRRKLDLLFRQGGEEFVLLLPDTRVTEAVVVAEELRRSIEKSRIVRSGAVTVSMGVDELRKGDTAERWMKRLDEALYRAKAAGRNCVVSADPRAAELRPMPLRRSA